MLVVKSKSQSDLRYLFESRTSPVSAQELAAGNFIGVPGTIEATLTMERGNAPIDERCGLWNAIMKDCNHPEIQYAYGDCYAALMRYLAANQIKDNPYRILSVRLTSQK